MGHVRIAVESAFRDVLAILRRARCADDLIRFVSARMCELLADIASHEDYTGRRGDIPSEVVCGEIVDQIFDAVTDSIGPQRRVEYLERYVTSLKSEREDLRRTLDVLRREDEFSSGSKARQEQAATYMVDCYFKEVLLLRRQLAECQTQQQQLLQQQQRQFVPSVSSSNQGSRHNSSSDIQGMRLVGNAQIYPPSIIPATPVKLRETLVPTPTTNTPSAHGKKTFPQQRSSFDISISASPSLTGTPLQGAMPPPPPASCGPTAIFDYYEFIRLKDGAEHSSYARYIAAVKEFEEFRAEAYAERDRAKEANAMILQMKNDQLAELRERISQLSTTLCNVKKQTSITISALREELKEIKEMVQNVRRQQIVDMSSAMQATGDEGLYHNTFVEYVKAGLGYLASQAETLMNFHSTARTDSISGGGLSDMTTFLHPQEEDSEAKREAKLFWRSHPVVESFFDTVNLARRTMTTGRDLNRKMEVYCKVQEKLKQHSREKAEHTATTSPSISLAATTSDIAATEKAFGGSMLGDIEQAKEPLPMDQCILLSADRKFLRKLYSMAADPFSDLSPEERNSIKKAEEIHRKLAIAKNKNLFHRIESRIVHRQVIENIREVLLKEGVNTMIAYEGEQFLREKHKIREVNSVMEWNALNAALDENAVKLLSSLDANVMQRTMGRKKSFLLRQQQVPRPPGAWNRLSQNATSRQSLFRGGDRSSLTRGPRSTSFALVPSDPNMEGTVSQLDSSTVTGGAGSVGGGGIANLLGRSSNFHALIQPDVDDEAAMFQVKSLQKSKYAIFVPTMGGVGTTALQQGSVQSLVRRITSQQQLKPQQQHQQQQQQQHQQRPQTGSAQRPPTTCSTSSLSTGQLGPSESRSGDSLFGQRSVASARVRERPPPREARVQSARPRAQGIG